MVNKLWGFNIISFLVKENSKWKNPLFLGMSYNKTDALKKLEEFEKKEITNVLIKRLSVTLKRIFINNPTQILKEQMQELAKQFDGAQEYKENVRAYNV